MLPRKKSNKLKPQGLEHIKVIGHARFKAFPLEIQDHLITANTKEFLIKQRWGIIRSNVKRLFKILEFIDEATIKILNIKGVKFFSFDSINPIVFRCLREIYITSCNVTNIEKLTFLEMPLIERLALNDNPVKSIQALNKSDWRYIKKIDLSTYFDELELTKCVLNDGLHRMNLKAKQIELRLWAYINNYSYLARIQPQSALIFINPTALTIKQTRMQRTIQRRSKTRSIKFIINDRRIFQDQDMAENQNRFFGNIVVPQNQPRERDHGIVRNLINPRNNNDWPQRQIGAQRFDEPVRNPIIGQRLNEYQVIGNNQRHVEPQMQQRNHIEPRIIEPQMEQRQRSDSSNSHNDEKLNYDSDSDIGSDFDD